MNEKIKAIEKYLGQFDEYDPSLMAHNIVENFGISYGQAWQIIVPAPPPAKPKNECCHYCGCPAKKYGFFDEPVCEECG